METLNVQGVSAPGGCLLQGGVCSRGVSTRGVFAPGGCLLWGFCSWGCLLCILPGEMATAADGTHPSGMHSC